jgi:hypothetical protein
MAGLAVAAVLVKLEIRLVTPLVAMVYQLM